MPTSFFTEKQKRERSASMPLGTMIALNRSTLSLDVSLAAPTHAVDLFD
jgi:hypothetical protein